MTNDQRFYFKDMEPIIGKKPAYILVNSRLEMQNVNGKDAAVMLIEMEGYDQNNQVMFKVKGCPYPPCKPAHSINLEADTSRR